MLVHEVSHHEPVEIHHVHAHGPNQSSSLSVSPKKYIEREKKVTKQRSCLVITLMDNRLTENQVHKEFYQVCNLRRSLYNPFSKHGIGIAISDSNRANVKKVGHTGEKITCT